MISVQKKYLEIVSHQHDFN